MDQRIFQQPHLLDLRRDSGRNCRLLRRLDRADRRKFSAIGSFSALATFTLTTFSSSVSPAVSGAGELRNQMRYAATRKNVSRTRPRIASALFRGDIPFFSVSTGTSDSAIVSSSPSGPTISVFSSIISLLPGRPQKVRFGGLIVEDRFIKQLPLRDKLILRRR